MCYSYRDQQAREEARNRMAREREERERREERAEKHRDGPTPRRERELART